MHIFLSSYIKSQSLQFICSFKKVMENQGRERLKELSATYISKKIPLFNILTLFLPLS